MAASEQSLTPNASDLTHRSHPEEKTNPTPESIEESSLSPASLSESTTHSSSNEGPTELKQKESDADMEPPQGSQELKADLSSIDYSDTYINVLLHRLPGKMVLQKPKPTPKPSNLGKLVAKKKTGRGRSGSAVLKREKDNWLLTGGEKTWHNQLASKPKPPPKPSNLRELVTKKTSRGRSDSTGQRSLFLLGAETQVPTAAAVATGSKQSKLAPSNYFEDIYDDIIVSNIQSKSASAKNKPTVPPKPESLCFHPEVLKLRSLKETEEIEEIYDTGMEILEQTDLDKGGTIKDSGFKGERFWNRSNSDGALDLLEEIYDEAVDYSESEEQSEYEISLECKNKTDDLDSYEISLEDFRKNKVADDSESKVGVYSYETTLRGGFKNIPRVANSDKRRSKFDPLPKEGKAFGEQDAISSDEEGYEDLFIYEELPAEKKEDDGAYQNINDVKIEALGLPRSIRSRATGMAKGPQRTRLKRRLTKINRSNSEKVEDSEKLVTEKKEEDPSSINGKQISAESRSPEGEEDEETDGLIPRDKAYKVLELLLEANNVKKTEARPSLQKQKQLPAEEMTQQHSTTRVNQKSLSLEMTPEMKDYHKAGVIKVKTTEEMAAEIEKLVENAPTVPPPLPGFQRPRTGRTTGADTIIRKRKILQKMSTYS